MVESLKYAFLKCYRIIKVLPYFSNVKQATVLLEYKVHTEHTQTHIPLAESRGSLPRDGTKPPNKNDHTDTHHRGARSTNYKRTWHSRSRSLRAHPRRADPPSASCPAPPIYE